MKLALNGVEVKIGTLFQMLHSHPILAKRDVKHADMNTHDLLMLALLLTPGILLSVAIMATFAAGG